MPVIAFPLFGVLCALVFDLVRGWRVTRHDVSRRVTNVMIWRKHQLYGLVLFPALVVFWLVMLYSAGGQRFVEDALDWRPRSFYFLFLGYIPALLWTRLLLFSFRRMHWREAERIIAARKQAAPDGTCSTCGYDLRGSVDRCSECGEGF